MIANAVATPAAPVSADEFDALLARLGGFEPRPRLAVAVSGGADSLALALLCQRWTAARAGEITTLTVDHRLRPESTAEAETVGRILAERGIAHTILTWHGDKPSTGLQEAAREARYRLLLDHCAEHGLLHLLLAHHRDDQAETLLLRLAHGSGLDGLSGMAAVRELAHLRLLRPVLTLPKARLTATCAEAGLTWIDDPSNRAPRFARARLRAAGEALDREGLSAARLAASAHKLGQARAALDLATARLLADAVALDPAGFLTLDPETLSAAPSEIGQRGLARALAVIGDGGYPPRRERLLRLYHAIGAGTAVGRTLAGCRFLPYERHLLLVRETVAIAPPEPLPTDRRVWWDRRFLVRRSASVEGRGAVLVGRLDADGWRAIRERLTPAARRLVPESVRETLPTLMDDDGPLAVPHLGFSRDGSQAHGVEAIFMPAQALAGPMFAVA